MYRMNRKGSRRKPTMRRVYSPICVALGVIIVEAAIASQHPSSSPERAGKYISESDFRRLAICTEPTSCGQLLLPGHSARDPDWLVSDSGWMTGQPEVIPGQKSGSGTFRLAESWFVGFPDK